MIGPNGTNVITTTQLVHIHMAVEHMTDLENQDRAMVIEMSQSMLYDLIAGDGLRPMADYVRKYCTVIDSADEGVNIAADILASG